MSSRKRRRKSNTHIFAIICNALGTIFLIAVILACIPLTLPRLLGYQVYTVISGSMEPAIKTGSLVFVKGEAPENIAKGDIIVFYAESGDGAIITHRVVSNRIVSGEFITRGDANAAEDINPVSYDSLIGKVTWSVPAIGRILAVAATTPGKLTAAGLIAVAFILHIVAGRLREET